MRRFKSLLSTWVIAFGFAGLVGGTVLTTTSATSVSAAAPTSAADCSARFLTFPTWFRGLIKFQSGECRIISPGETPDGSSSPLELSGYIWRIALNVLEIGLQLVAYIALGFVIFGGFQYLVGGSNAATLEKGRVTLLNAVIGLGISLGSIAVTNLIFALLG